MGILAGIGWVVLGVLYVVYKIGEEEFNLGKLGGIGCVFFVVFFVTLFATIANFSEELAGILAFVGVFSIPIWAFASNKQAKKRQQARQEELFEIRIIRNDLPMPTLSQMTEFIDDILYTEEPSQQQLEYRVMLRKAEANTTTPPLDANHFRDMQAAWIYYSKNGIHSQERKRIFGDRELSEMKFFELSANNSEESEVISYTEVFRKAVEQLAVKIKLQWLNQPKFFRKVRGMIDKSIPLTEETLYPIMLESYNKSSDWTLHWMQDDVIAVRVSLLPKIVHVLAQIPMARKEQDEWLKVEEFQVTCLPAIREKRNLSSEEIFPALLKTYNGLLDKDFACQPQKYNFVALWNGLNSVGKAIGKEGSFFDYPKYIFKAHKEADHDHQ